MEETLCTCLLNKREEYYHVEIRFRSKDGIRCTVVESNLDSTLCSSTGRTNDFIIERFYLCYGERDATFYI